MTVSLLQSKSILKNELLLIRLLDRTFKRACDVRTLNYKTELPNNVKKEFGKNIFSLQFDKYITEIIKESLIYADKTMKKMAAAKVNESYILTEEAVRISKDLSQEASESIVRILQDDAIYYEHPKALSKRIVDLWGGEKYRAERFARTFTADVATATTVARYRQYGVRYMEFDAELDDRTTDQCRCLNGTIFDLTKDSVDRYRPPLHHHCVIKGTKINTSMGERNIEDIQVGDKVLTHLCHYMPVTETMNHFPDKLVDLHTSSYHVRITPNHPILQWDMFNGVYQWVNAGDLRDGSMICTVNGYEFVSVVHECEPEQVYNISVSEDESYIANGIVVHNCRSGLVPLTDDEYQPDMEFENRNFDSVLENPDDVSRAFKNIDKFNDKYRVSKFTLDQDIGARIMFDKGFSVGISGPDLSGLVNLTEESPIRISNNMISRLPKTHYEIMTELKNEGMMEFDSQVRFLQSVLRNKQWHNVKLSDEDVQIFKKVYLDYLTESKKYKDYAAGLSKLSDDDLLKEYQTLRNGKQKTAVFDWYSENDMSKLDSMVTEALGYTTDSTRSGLLAGLSQEEREQVTKSYYATQEYLKRKYPSGKITVYRGVTSDAYKELAANGLDSAVDVGTYNLSCWTENVNVARGFTVSKDGGVVLKADVPIEKVYMHYDISNPIHDFEKEITTLGDEMSATVYDIRDAKSTYTRKEKIEMELERERLQNLPKEPKKENELDFDAMFGF